MLDTDEVFLSSAKLLAKPSLRIEALDELGSIVRSERYQDWLIGVSQRYPFRVKTDRATRALDELGLVKGDVLRVKVNAIGEHYMATDGVWVDRRFRVFPFSDESEAIAAYCKRRGLDRWANRIIDLATGCGHSLAHFDNHILGIGMDINPRAIAYFQFNRLLNGNLKWVAILNDIRNGIPPVIEGGAEKKCLLLGNIPFGWSPKPNILAQTSDGGEDGLALQKAALTELRKYRKSMDPRASCAVILAYSLGDASQGTWQTVDLVRSIFRDDITTFSILENEGLMRVDGKRILCNPSPLQNAFRSLSECRLYFNDLDGAQAAYSEFGDRMIELGFRDLAYMIVQIGESHRHEPQWHEGAL